MATISNKLTYLLTYLRERKGRKPNERKEKVHKVNRHYIPTIGEGQTLGLIPIKFGVLVAPRDVIIIYNFCNKFSGVSDLQGANIPVFPLTLLVILTTVLHYCEA